MSQKQRDAVLTVGFGAVIIVAFLISLVLGTSRW